MSTTCPKTSWEIPAIDHPRMQIENLKEFSRICFGTTKLAPLIRCAGAPKKTSIWSSLLQEVADFFYIPAQLCHYFVEKRDTAIFSHCQDCERLDRRIVEFMNSVGPYFSRHGGADHLVTSLRCPRLREPTRFDHAFPNLWGKESGQGLILLCLQSTSSKNQDHIRALHMPYYVNFSLWHRKEIAMQKRDFLVYFAGSL